MSRPNTAARILPIESREWAHHALTLRAPGVHDASFEPDALAELLRNAIAAAGLVAPVEHAHRFEPQGFSFVAFGPAVRVVLHTWPERGVATLDVHGPVEEPALRGLIDALFEASGWLVVERHRIERGTPGR